MRLQPAKSCGERSNRKSRHLIRLSSRSMKESAGISEAYSRKQEPKSRPHIVDCKPRTPNICLRTRTHLLAITWSETGERLLNNRSLPLNNTPRDRPVQTEIIVSKPRSHTPILRALHLQKNPRTTLAIRVTLENVILHLFARAGGVLFLASKFHDRLVFAVAFFALGVSEDAEHPGLKSFFVSWQAYVLFLFRTWPQ
jgi:hypothetical protein